MSRGGHNRKTLAQAERDGTARSDRHVEPAVLAPGAPERPDWLSDEAAALWDELVPVLAEGNAVERVDALPLAQLFEAAALARIAREKIGNEPVIEVVRYTKNGDEYIELQKNPAMGAWKDASAVVRSLIGEFGMTALARTRLGDALRTPGHHGPQLPQGAPAPYTPPAAALPKQSTRRARLPRCADHGRRWRKKCKACQRLVAAEKKA
jgi:P27 family predicted phage terminase small subunit